GLLALLWWRRRRLLLLLRSDDGEDGDRGGEHRLIGKRARMSRGSTNLRLVVIPSNARHPERSEGSAPQPIDVQTPRCARDDKVTYSSQTKGTDQSLTLGRDEMHRLRTLILVAAFAGTAALRAQVPADLPARIDKVFARFDLTSPGCAVGLAKD